MNVGSLKIVSLLATIWENEEESTSERSPGIPLGMSVLIVHRP